MTKSDKLEFAKAFTACYMAFDKEPNEDQMRVYFDLLSDHDITQVSAAFRCHIKDPDRGRFFPKVADIIYQIEMQTPKIDFKFVCELEWSKVIKAAANGLKPKTDDQYTLAALQLIGGFNRVGYADIKDLYTLKASFAANYQALATAPVSRLPDHLDNVQALVKLKTGLVKL